LDGAQGAPRGRGRDLGMPRALLISGSAFLPRGDEGEVLGFHIQDAGIFARLRRNAAPGRARCPRECGLGDGATL
jgi:hypothetical protein